MGSKSDEELLNEYRSGSIPAAEELLARYKGLVRRKARGMFLLGGDKEDLLQEGMIALFTAIREYEPGKAASFSTFAELLVERKLYSAIRSGQRKKHTPLNLSVSIDEAEETPDLGLDPESLMIAEENREALEDYIDKNLSPLEKEVFSLSMTGLSTSRIAKLLGKEAKSTDNALQRARGKLKKAVLQ